MNVICRVCSKPMLIRPYKQDQCSDCFNEYRRNHRKKNPEKHMLYNAHARAKTTDIIFDLKLKDIVIPKICPVLKIPLFIGTGQPTNNSPSIDKIIPELGYTPINIVIVSHRANSIKNNASFDEIKLIFNNYYNSHKGPTSSKFNLSNKLRILRSVRHNIKNRDLDFNLSIDDFNIPDFCPILNIELNFEKGRKINYQSPSLDRINNNYGYVPNNIRIISTRANTLKSDSSYEEYEKIYLFYKDIIKSRNLL